MRKKHAPTEVLSSSKKFIYKEKCGTVTKLQSLINLLIKVTLHCYCVVNVKHGFISKTLVSMKATICWLRKCQSNEKLF